MDFDVELELFEGDHALLVQILGEQPPPEDIEEYRAYRQQE
jgi:hypothetical protein